MFSFILHDFFVWVIITWEKNISCLESGCTMSLLLSTVPNFDAEDLVQQFEKKKEVKFNSNFMSSISIVKLSAIGQPGYFFRCGVLSLVVT